jgi:hypothetical protein
MGRTKGVDELEEDYTQDEEDESVKDDHESCMIVQGR